jgi:6,7-dimethyl-8-ribityllumazine synthase
MAGPSTGPLNDPDRFKGLPDRVGFTPLVLMLVAPYYGDVADALVKGAEAEFEKAGVNVKRIDVPGALELPQALQIVLDGDTGFAVDAAVAIGCVIRGETSHYDIVCNETNRGLMTIALDARVPLGNAVLTVDTHAQAMARATVGATGKGGDAARAALALLEIKCEHGYAPLTVDGEIETGETVV